MKQLLDLYKDVEMNGDYVEDRTGTGCYSVFGRMLRWNLQKGFPLTTTKKVIPALPIGELLWMLAGCTDLPSLRKYQNKEKDSRTIWSADFEKFWEGLSSSNAGYYSQVECGGFIYGAQLRHFVAGCHPEDYDTKPHDQLEELLTNIRGVRDNPKHPMGRRLIVSWWNPEQHTVGDKKVCALPACHTDFQCIVRDGKLNLRFSMRSSDIFLGLPFNIAFYAALTHILAQLTNLEVGELVYMGTDVHMYSNHTEQIALQRTRGYMKLPEIVMPEFSTLTQLANMTAKDFKIVGYAPHDTIKAPQAS